MKKLKLFVVCHKPTELPKGDVYVPFHVGRKLSLLKEQMKEYVGDDTGDNISEKNPYYCEATAIYWIWKNEHDAEYVGINHYRRRFVPDFTDDNIDLYFSDGTDALMVSNYFRFYTRWFTSLQYLQTEDLIIVNAAIIKLYPEYQITFNQFLRDYVDHPFNMVICKKELYNNYAKWLFDICFEVEKYWKASNYPNGKRALAYITELLTPIYFIHNHKKIKPIGVLVNNIPFKQTFINKILMHFFHNIVWHFTKNRPLFPREASFYSGLELP